MEGGAWQATVHGVTKSRTQLSNFTHTHTHTHICLDRLIGKDSDAGRDWGQEEKGTTQDEMAGWHH